MALIVVSVRQWKLGVCLAGARQLGGETGYAILRACPNRLISRVSRMRASAGWRRCPHAIARIQREPILGADEQWLSRLLARVPFLGPLKN